MGIINEMPSSSGMQINGTTQNYYVYQNTTVQAGDFVEETNGIAIQRSATPSIFKTEAITKELRVCKLGYNKALIFYVTDTAAYLKVATITNYMDISYGSEYTISAISNPSNLKWVQLSYINSTTALLTYNISSTAYGMVLQVNGTTITMGTSKTFGSNYYYCASCGLTEAGEFFYCYSNTSNSTENFRGAIGTISGLNISLGSSYIIYTQNGYSFSDCCKLTANTVAVAHKTSTKNIIHATGVTRSGTTITAYGNANSLNNYISDFCIRRHTNSQALLFTNDTDSDRGDCYAVDYSEGATTCTTSKAYVSQYDCPSNMSACSTSMTSDSEIAFVSNCYSGFEVITGVGYSSFPSNRTNYYTLPDAYKYGPSDCCTINDGFILIAYPQLSTQYGQAMVVYVTPTVPTNIYSQTETQVKKATTRTPRGVAKGTGIGGTATDHGGQVTVYVPNV